MRVLVVEDEPDLMRALVQILHEEGYAVDSTMDGAEGLYKSLAWDYDTIVLDLMLPSMNGLELLKQLRRKKKTPVLVLTARDTVPDRVLGLDGGADDYLVKPFARMELLARVRALIRRSAGQAQPILEIGDIRIDTVKRNILRGESVIAVTAREYSLVELLALHRGRLVTRSMIYEHLFNENDDTLSNLVEVHVSNIRKKLGKDFIVTRRGLGYVIDA